MALSLRPSPLQLQFFPPHSCLLAFLFVFYTPWYQYMLSLGLVLSTTFKGSCVDGVKN